MSSIVASEARVDAAATCRLPALRFRFSIEAARQPRRRASSAKASGIGDHELALAIHLDPALAPLRLEVDDGGGFRPRNVRRNSRRSSRIPGPEVPLVPRLSLQLRAAPIGVPTCPRLPTGTGEGVERGEDGRSVAAPEP